MKTSLVLNFNEPTAYVKFFKGCLPQISLGPFLNTLSHFTVELGKKDRDYVTSLFLARISIEIKPATWSLIVKKNNSLANFGNFLRKYVY